MSTATILARVATLNLSLVLGACVTLDTPYEPYSPDAVVNAGGYTETEVQPGVFLVQFIGNNTTPPDLPADYALLRAADLCIQRGKDYMFVGNPVTHYMRTGNVPATNTVVPASESSQVVSTMPPTLPISPTGGVMVSCTDTKADGAWDAQFLARAIRAKYSLS